MCFSMAILSYNIMWCSFHPMADNYFLISSSLYHRASIVGWHPCFPCRAFCQHLFRMVVHLLSFRSSVLGSTTAVLLNHVSRDSGDVTVVLVELRWTPRRIHISSTHAIDNFHFQASIAVRTLQLEEFSQSSKISMMFKSAIKSCDSLLNLLIFCVWLKS